MSAVLAAKPAWARKRTASASVMGAGGGAEAGCGPGAGSLPPPPPPQALNAAAAANAPNAVGAPSSGAGAVGMEGRSRTAVLLLMGRDCGRLGWRNLRASSAPAGNKPGPHCKQA
eukprot:Opistho-2@70544